MGARLLGIGAWTVTAICLVPILATVLAALAGELGTWRGLVGSVLPGYVVNTLLLALSVAFGSVVVGRARPGSSPAIAFPVPGGWKC